MANKEKETEKTQSELKNNDLETLKKEIDTYFETQKKDKSYIIPIECGELVRQYNIKADELGLEPYKF